MLADIGMGTVGDARARLGDAQAAGQDHCVMTTDPSTFLADPAHIALVISALALLVSAASFFVAWRNYRRSGFKIKVALTRKVTAHENYPSRDPVYKITLITAVTNHRMGSIEVTGFIAQDKEGKRLKILPNGPRLHHVLVGVQRAEWTSSISKDIEGEAPAPGSDTRVRIGAVLATGKTVWSRWLKVGHAESEILMTPAD